MGVLIGDNFKVKGTHDAKMSRNLHQKAMYYHIFDKLTESWFFLSLFFQQHKWSDLHTVGNFWVIRPEYVLI